MPDDQSLEQLSKTLALPLEELVGIARRREEAQEQTPADKRAYLIVDLENNPPRLVPVGADMLVGRTGQAGLEIADESVSRRHARIYRAPNGEFILEDLGSTNGTLVNGIARKEHLLQAGDRIQFGKTRPCLVSFHSRFEDYLAVMQKFELETKWATGTSVVMQQLLQRMESALEGITRQLGGVEGTPLGVELAALRATSQDLAKHLEKLRIFAGCVGQELQPLNLSSLLQNLALRLILPRDRAIKVVTDVEPHLWSKGNVRLLTVAFEELCSNAAQAMPDGGLLEIAASITRVGPDEAFQKPYLAPGLAVRVSISDTGVGMSPEIQRLVLTTPFFTTRGAGLGIGFGIMLAHRVIGVHGGHLELQRRKPGGTIAEALLPAIEEPEEPFEPVGGLP
jgi:signal transduction histidine kinase